jgi:hypothetical protein
LVDDNEQKSAPRAEDLYWEEEQEIDLRNFVEGNDTIN